MAVFVAIYPYALKEKAVCASINTLLLAIFLDHLRQGVLPLDAMLAPPVGTDEKTLPDLRQKLSAAGRAECHRTAPR